MEVNALASWILLLKDTTEGKIPYFFMSGIYPSPLCYTKKKTALTLVNSQPEVIHSKPNWPTPTKIT